MTLTTASSESPRSAAAPPIFSARDVAPVVLDDVDDPGSAVHSLGGGQHLIGDRGREDLAGARGVEHADAHEATVERLVSRSAAGDQRDLALDRRIRPNQDLVRDVVSEHVRYGGGEPGKRFFDHLVRFVDDFPHAPGGCGHGSALLLFDIIERWSEITLLARGMSMVLLRWSEPVP